MTSFAGYELPLRFPAGILPEHRHTRRLASLFDVSHMGQFEAGTVAHAALLESIIAADFHAWPAQRQRYVLLTNEAGGIVDDVIVTRLAERFLLTANAARCSALAAHCAALAPALPLHLREERALLALQGPAAAAVLQRCAPEVSRLAFLEARNMELAGAPCWVARCGYTGEDGFEISLPAAEAERIARLLLKQKEVAPAGLAARDLLRLEAGLCLYGQDLDETTTPVEAGLQWTIPRVRRSGGSRAGGFPGAEIILRQLREGAARYRVGIRAAGRIPLRAGAILRDASGKKAGEITSGSYSPNLSTPFAMAYVGAAYRQPGTALCAQVRGREQPATVVSLPVVAPRHLGSKANSAPMLDKRAVSR